jgi:proteasome accessory factor A
MSQKMVFLKMGATALMLSMIEDGYALPAFEILDPVASMHQVSHDIDFEQQLILKDGRKVSAIDVQRAYLESASSYVAELGIADAQTAEVLELWAYVLNGLATDPASLKTTIDWIAKRNLLDAYRERDSLHWRHPRLSAIDLQYADLRMDKGLAYILQASGGLDTMFTSREIHEAVSNPPSDTRAFFRGKCVATFGEAVVAASWDSVIFDVCSDQDLMRITTPDVRKGTQELTSHLFDSKSILQFLEELQAESESAIQ